MLSGCISSCDPARLMVHPVTNRHRIIKEIVVEMFLFIFLSRQLLLNNADLFWLTNAEQAEHTNRFLAT